MKRKEEEIFVASVITLKGIDQAISDLNFRNKNSLKYRLVDHIRQSYEDEGSIASIREINGDELIKALWNTGTDPAAIKKKRKNLSSIKSSVNANLKELFREGENSEGICIGPGNIFEMSDQAKDQILKQFTDSVEGDEAATMGQMLEVLNILKETLSNPEIIKDSEDVNGLSKLEQLRSLIQGLWENVGLLDTDEPEESEGIGEDDEPIEEVEVEDEIEEIGEAEVVEDLEDEEIDEAIEEGEDEEDLEELEEGIEPEDEDLEELEEIDEIDEVDEIDEAEAVEELEEEIEPIDEDLEEVEVEDDFEEIDVAEGDEEAGLPVGDLDEGFDKDEEIRENKLLAEEFDSYLAAMDRYYNQYLLIPGGKYVVAGKQTGRDEKPDRLVQLSPFYMGKFPVTNGLFEIFVEKTGYRTSAESLGYGTVYYGRFQKATDEKTGREIFKWNSALISKNVEGAYWYQPFGPGSTLHQKRNHPVVQVSLKDAMAFAAWTGKRLPTCDDWEAASRTANGHAFPWGDEWKEEACNIEESSIGDTSPVEKYADYENEFGIVDTIGNVLEWTLDSSRISHSAKERSRFHVVKGGSWVSGKDINLSSFIELESESHSNILGFRCIAY